MRSGWLGVVLAAVLVGCVSEKVGKEEDVIGLKARAPLPLERRRKLAVVEFNDKSGFGQGRLGSGASEVLITLLSDSGQFRLYERLSLDKVRQELSLTSGFSLDAAGAAQLGRKVGVEYVVIGAVTAFGVKREGSDFLLYSEKRLAAEATVDVRVVHCKTGEIVFAASGRGKAAKQAGRVVGLGGRFGYDETLAGKSLRAAIAKWVDRLIDRVGTHG